MTYKYLIIAVLFYFFALLQNSFFTHFNLFGYSPDLVFILYFLLIFFADAKHTYQIIFISAVGGFCLDVFSYTYLGPYIILFLLLAFLLKKTQSLLRNNNGTYPLVYFLPLFAVFLLANNLIMGSYSSIKIIFPLIYSSVVAALFYYIYKRYFNKAGNKPIW